MQAITDPVTPLEAGGEMFERASKTQSFLFPRSSLAWPLPAHADLSDTDFEDDGSVSDDDDYSPKGSFETVRIRPGRRRDGVAGHSIIYSFVRDAMCSRSIRTTAGGVKRPSRRTMKRRRPDRAAATRTRSSCG